MCVSIPIYYLATFKREDNFTKFLFLPIYYLLKESAPTGAIVFPLKFHTI